MELEHQTSGKNKSIIILRTKKVIGQISIKYLAPKLFIRVVCGRYGFLVANKSCT